MPFYPKNKGKTFKTKHWVDHPRVRYKQKMWRKDAFKHLKRMNWKGAKGMVRNALTNYKKRSYKVGWTAGMAKGKSHSSQYKWRKNYYKNHGRVV